MSATAEALVADTGLTVAGGLELARSLGFKHRLAQRSTGEWFSNHRFAVTTTADGAAWAVGILFATLIRYNLSLTAPNWLDALALAPLAYLAQLAAGVASGVYRGMWRLASFDEIGGLVRSVLFTTAAVVFLDAWISKPRLVPLSGVVGGGVAALMLMCGYRFVVRAGREGLRRPRGASQRVVVFGAGEGGAQVVRAMLSDPDSPYLPVALIDDDPSKRNLRIMGVPVLGTRDDLAAVARKTDAKTVLLAIPSMRGGVVGDINDRASEAGLKLKTLPPVSDLFGDTVDLVDIRDVGAEDLLGRHQIHTDIDAIAGYITGKRVLVTGAGGSIGSELCRQIYRYAPAELMMLDRDESALHSVQLSMEGKALLDSPNLILKDIRDRIGLGRLFAERKPDVVFHAAALKHLPLLEANPGEAVKTNVWGTLALLEAAAEAGVERFINISTDKAADPVSVLGYSKRICERLTAQIALETGRPYLSVRFGNVLGSRGSVLTAFNAQVAAGGPITVTHPDVTRFFMTIEEAVQLVIQAGAIGSPGEALVLDMGDPVKIDDVARLLASRAKRPVEIVYTGLRHGEKLNEALLGEGEDDVRPVHPLISHVQVPPLATHLVQDLDPTDAARRLRGMLKLMMLTPARVAKGQTTDR